LVDHSEQVLIGTIALFAALLAFIVRQQVPHVLCTISQVLLIIIFQILGEFSRAYRDLPNAVDAKFLRLFQYFASNRRLHHHAHICPVVLADDHRVSED
jgi:hypothetical protein